MQSELHTVSEVAVNANVHTVLLYVMPVVNYVCDAPVLDQQLDPYLTTDMLF